MKNETMRQGDVLIKKIEILPDDLKEINGNRLVLAEGEATGHAHAIYDIQNCHMYAAPNEDLYIKVSKKVDLLHEEHGKIPINEGIYQVIKQVEVIDEIVKPVVD